MKKNISTSVQWGTKRHEKKKVVSDTLRIYVGQMICSSHEHFFNFRISGKYKPVQ